MKILWIEDFGSNLAPSKIVIEIFKGLFGEVNLRKEYNRHNRDVAGQLSELFRKHTLHEIYLCESYVEWKRAYEQHKGDFDIALIDINLESDPTPDDEMPPGIENRNFDKKAGFHIYHQLIKRGFPDDNIAFFTGEEQSLDEFSRYCGDIFLDRPRHCFEKNPVHFEQLRQWLVEKSKQESLILRRGVIEGCNFVRERVKAIDKADLESCLIFYKTTSKITDGDPETFRRDTLDYLARLERFFLPHHAYDKADLPYLFIKELADKWEEGKGYFIRAKEMPDFGTWLESRFHKTAQFQMKMLRNWSSHKLLSPALTAKEVAYFFMVALRSWLESDLSEIFRYEEILSTLFDQLSDPELNRLTHSRLGLYLEQSYEQLRAVHTEALRHLREPSEERKVANNLSRRIDNYFLAIFRELGESADRLKPDVLLFYQRRIREESLKLFYQSFWHGLFPLRIKTTFYANLQSVEFDLEPLPISFMSFLGRSIFKECFKEDGVSINVPLATFGESAQQSLT